MPLDAGDATWSAIYTYFDRAEGFLEKMRVFDASRSVSRRAWGPIERLLVIEHRCVLLGVLAVLCARAHSQAMLSSWPLLDELWAAILM